MCKGMRSEKEIDAKIGELNNIIMKGEKTEENRLRDLGSVDALLWVLKREHIGLPNRPT